MIMAILITRRLFKRSGKGIFRITSLIGMLAYSLFLLSFIIIEGLMVYELQQSKNVDPEEVDYVIILGAGLQGDELSNTLKKRLQTGTEFLENHDDIPVVVSGGQGPGESISEAEAMGNYLIEEGISEDRIHYEKKSTTTYQNLNYTKQLLKGLGAQDPKVLIITSEYHLVRAR